MPFNNIDLELLGKLYRESQISDIKRNSIKKTKWQEIAMKYSNQKNLPLMDYKILLRKWSRVVKLDRKARALSMKYSTAADLDIGSDFDCEPNRRSDEDEIVPEDDINEDDSLHLSNELMDEEMPSLNNESVESSLSDQSSMTKVVTVGPIEEASLFKNLSSWKEESQNQILNAINSYDKSMRDTIFNLVQEVHSLKTQLSVTTKEKKALINTVNKLNVEILELNAKLSNADPLMEPEDNKKDTNETAKISEEVQNGTEDMAQYTGDFTNENLRSIDIEYEKENKVKEASSQKQTQNAPQGSQHTLKEHLKFTCDICGFKTNEIRDLQKHFTTAHLMNDVDLRNIGNRMFKCDQCSYTSPSGISVKRHIKVAHDKTGGYDKDKVFPCPDCGSSFGTRSRLKTHINEVHKN